jgi:hypothetical protein
MIQNRCFRWTLALAGAIFLAQPAAAQVTCGATLVRGQKVTLVGDVGPCTSSTDPAIFVQGPATLDLNGFKILCTGGSPPNGAVLEGKKARLRNGSIHACNDGVRLAGEGGHQVDNVAVIDGDRHGFDIESDKNRLRGNLSHGGLRGFTLSGDNGRNQFKDNIAIGHSAQGIDINGDRNKVSENVSIENGASGFYCDDCANGNKWSKNVVGSTSGVCVE